MVRGKAYTLLFFSLVLATLAVKAVKVSTEESGDSCNKCAVYYAEFRRVANGVDYNDTKMYKLGDLYCKLQVPYDSVHGLALCEAIGARDTPALVEFADKFKDNTEACYNLGYCEATEALEAVKDSILEDQILAMTPGSTPMSDIRLALANRAEAKINAEDISGAKFQQILNTKTKETTDDERMDLRLSKREERYKLAALKHCSPEEVERNTFPTVEKCLELADNERRVYPLQLSRSEGRNYEAKHICWYGGDELTCSGHGLCQNYQVLLEHSDGSLVANKTATCDCDEGWAGRDCSQWTKAHKLPAIFVKDEPNPSKNAAATMDWYCDLSLDNGTGSGCGGMCIGSSYSLLKGANWHLGNALPYGVRGVAAVNPTMFGEHKPHSKESPLGHEVGHASGCGKCFRLKKAQKERVVAVVDRCSGSCAVAESGGNCAVDGSPVDTKKKIGCDKCAAFGMDAVNPLPSGIDAKNPGVFKEVDWCAANDHPHFSVDRSTMEYLCGGAGACTIDLFEEVQCDSIEADWDQGCDEENWSNCPSTLEVEMWDSSFFDRDWEGAKEDGCACKSVPYRTNFSSHSSCLDNWKNDEWQPCVETLSASTSLLRLNSGSSAEGKEILVNKNIKAWNWQKEPDADEDIVEIKDDIYNLQVTQLAEGEMYDEESDYKRFYERDWNSASTCDCKAVYYKTSHHTKLQCEQHAQADQEYTCGVPVLDVNEKNF